jgi:DMSO/TMAO reductase YedYZ molybdopterin-dependent catalytic subunit
MRKEIEAENELSAKEYVENYQSGGISRKEFISKTALASLGAVLGTKLAFGGFIPRGYMPIAFDPALDPFELDGKLRDLIVLNDRPWNIETPAHLLDDKVTPAEKMFVRNNGLLPTEIDVESWTLTIDGESVPNPKSFSLKELKSKFQHHTYQLTLECGGNGRSEFNPPAKGNQWSVGAVSCANWTGVRLKDILEDVGINSDAVYIGYYGKDVHLSGDPTKTVISRGVPIKKAMEDETLIAWAMNGQDIPYYHGYPLRLVVGGWPASASGKWLDRIAVRNKIHDGPKMESPSYRVPCESVAPGTDVPAESMCIIESMPVKSVITYPKSGGMVKPGQSFTMRGHAWAGDIRVDKMELSVDYGQNWFEIPVQDPVNRMAWQHWETKIELEETGYYEVWARATDSEGRAQPMVVPGWNPKGYLNNACHRIAIKVSA